MINISVASSSPAFAHGIRVILTQNAEDFIFRDTRLPEEITHLLTSAEGQKTDVLIVDVDKAKQVKFLIKAREIKPELHIIVVLKHFDSMLIRESFQAGATGFLCRKCSISELQFALYEIMEGDLFLCQVLIDQFLRNSSGPENNFENQPEQDFLSSREMQVLRMVANGLSNQEIAERLLISKRTIEGHRQHLLSKTKSLNSVEMVRNAMRWKWIT